MGYILECYSADVGAVRADVRAGRDLATILFDTSVLLGSLQHASGSGSDFRSAIATALGNRAADQLLSRPDLLDFADVGGFPSVGGLTATELELASRRLEALLATPGAVPSGDEGDWLYELSAVIREARSEGRDLITLYR